MLRLGNFTWPNDPESLTVSYEQRAKSEIPEGGTWTVTSPGCTGRIFEGEGIFSGENAYTDFLSLAGYLSSGAESWFDHPHWPRARVILTELEAAEESRSNFIRYRFKLMEVP